MNKRGLVISIALFFLIALSQNVIAGCCLDPSTSFPSYNATSQSECRPGVVFDTRECELIPAATEVGCCVYDDRCSEVSERVDCDATFVNLSAPTCEGVSQCYLGCCVLQSASSVNCQYITQGSCDPITLGLPEYSVRTFEPASPEMTELFCETVYCDGITFEQLIKIEGWVISSEGYPVDNAQVKVGSTIVGTDSTGKYVLSSLVPGSMVFEVSAPNHVSEVFPRVYDFDDESVNFTLDFLECVIGDECGINGFYDENCVCQEPSLECSTAQDCLKPECDGEVCGNYKTCQNSQCLPDSSFCTSAGGVCDISANCYSGDKGTLGCPGSEVCCNEINLCKGADGCNFVDNVFCDSSANTMISFDVNNPASRGLYCSNCPADSDCSACDVLDGNCDLFNCPSDPDCDVPGGSLSGVVTNIEGEPVEGAVVIVGSIYYPFGQDITVEDGTFSISGLPLGTLTVTARAPGYAEFLDSNVFIGIGSYKEIVLQYADVDCDAETKPAPAQFEGEAVPGEEKVRLSWVKTCPNIESYVLKRTDGQLTTSLLADELFYVDEEVFWDVNYNYQIKAIYTGNNFESDWVNVSVSPGSQYCEGRFTDRQFCLNNEGGTFSDEGDLNAIVFCSENFPAVIDDCSVYDLTCAETTGGAVCKKKSLCEALGSPAGLFYEENTCLGTDDSNFCFYDYSDTTIDKCYDCRHNMTCFDYTSQNACEVDNCGVENCQWNPINNTEEFNGGICAPATVKEDVCEICSAQSDVFSNLGCTQPVCNLLGDCVSTNNLCVSCEDTICSDFIDEVACTGGIQKSQDASCNNFNRGANPCGLDVCRWSEGICFKDGDGDGLPDDGTQQDTTPPETEVSSIPEVVSSEGYVFTFLVDEDVTELYYSINDNCPSNVRASTGSPEIAVPITLNQTVEGLNTMYYYAKDNNNNNEVTKSFDFLVDTTPPQVFINVEVNNHTEDELKSVLNIGVSTDSTASCTDNFMGESGLGHVGGNLWSAVYQVNDGTYPYEVTCTDLAGNNLTEFTLINVARDLYITVVRPNVTTSDKPAVIELNTEDAASCAYGTQHQTFTKMSQTDGLSHMQSIGNLEDGLYSYQVNCLDSTLKSHVKNIVFTVDITPPSTTVNIRDSLFTFNQSFTNTDNWNSDFFYTALLTFTCSDPEMENGSIEFGCDRVEVCEGVNCEPFETAEPMTLTESQSICYRSVDKGNNFEETKCGRVNVDSDGPSITITEPVDGFSLTDNIVDLSGTFENKFSIPEVIRVQSGDSTKEAVITGTSWTAKNIPLEEGPNTVIATIYSLGQGSDEITVYSDTEGPNFVLDSPLPKVASKSLDVSGITQKSRRDNTIEGDITLKVSVNDIEITTTSSGGYEDIQEFTLTNPVVSGANSFDLAGTPDMQKGDFVQSKQNYDDSTAGTDTPRRYEVVDSFPSGSNTRFVVSPAFGEDFSSIAVSSTGTQTGRFFLNIPLEIPGRNKVVITAYDPVGNKGRSEWEYTFYDNVSPEIILSSLTPHDGDVIGTLKPIDAEVLDNFGVDAESVFLDVDGSLKSNIFTPLGKGGSLSYIISLPPAVDFEEFDMALSASDLVNNTASTAWSFTYDKDAPTLTSAIPKYTNSTTPTFTLTFDKDVDGGITVTVDNTPAITTAVDLRTYTVSSPVLTEGKHSMKIEAISGAKTGVANREFIVDTTSPIIQVTSGNITTTYTPTVRGTWSDTNGLESVFINQFMAEVEENTYTEGFFNGVISIDNTSNVKVSVKDKAGNEAEIQYTLTPLVVEPPFKVTYIEDALWMGDNVYRTDKNSVIAHGTFKRGDVDFIFEEILNDQASIVDDTFTIELFLETDPGEEVMNRINLIGVDYSGNQIVQELLMISDRKAPEEPDFEYE